MRIVHKQKLCAVLHKIKCQYLDARPVASPAEQWLAVIPGRFQCGGIEALSHSQVEGHAKCCFEQPDKTRKNAAGEAVCPGTLSLYIVPIVLKLKERTSEQVARCKNIAQPLKWARHCHQLTRLLVRPQYL